jgi:hypothetical protein
LDCRACRDKYPKNDTEKIANLAVALKNLAVALKKLRHELSARDVELKGSIEWELPMHSTLAVTIPVLWLMSVGVADAANPTQLAETGGFLLGNARRCGVPIERVETAGKVIHDFISAAARDSNEAAAADSRFSEIFRASALPDQDPDAFPSCTVVIQQFDRLERHHDQTRRNRETRVMSPAF